MIMMRPVMLGSIVQKLSWGNLVLLLSLLHPVVALSAVVAAIPIVNPSFEAQSLPIRTFTSGAITGWTAPGGQGTFRPSAFEYNGGGSPGLQTSPALGVPSGVNVAYSNGGTISQILNESLTAGRLYKLQ